MGLVFFEDYFFEQKREIFWRSKKSKKAAKLIPLQIFNQVKNFQSKKMTIFSFERQSHFSVKKKICKEYSFTLSKFQFR